MRQAGPDNAFGGMTDLAALLMPASARGFGILKAFKFEDALSWVASRATGCRLAGMFRHPVSPVAASRGLIRPLGGDGPGESNVPLLTSRSSGERNAKGNEAFLDVVIIEQSVLRR